MARLIAVLCILLGLCTPAHARERIVEIAGLTVHEWPPAVQHYERAPVVLFSHGLHGCGNQSTDLMEALSVKGYWVFAPDHADARCRGGATFSAPTAEIPAPPVPEPFADQSATDETSATAEDTQKVNRPARWTSATYRTRRDDLITLLDALRADPERQEQLDFTRIALAGHSLGGYTVLGMAGGWADWKEGWNSDGIRAVLTYAPYVAPFLRGGEDQKGGDIAGITLPVMYQAGARDNLVTTPLIREDTGIYAQTTAPKYLVVLKDAGHFAWTDINSRQHDRILRYSTAFLDHYLMGITAPTLTQGGKTLNRFAYESELGKTEPKAANTGGLIAGGKSGGTSTIRSGSWRDRESKFGGGNGGVIINDSRTRRAAENPVEESPEAPQSAD
ncbi:MAG: hypothetical protein FJX23_02775 [Alphaproteobacteria bacterium]|nr:hypothetical protein [Alphaproteobacteria bacterium]